MTTSDSGFSGMNGPKKKSRFKLVTATYKVQGGAQRDKAKCNVNRFGGSEGNVEMTDIWDRHLVTRGIDPNGDVLLAIGADEEREVVAIWGTTEPGPGVTTLRRYVKGASARIAFHLGAAFKQYPSLRPQHQEVECLVLEEIDEETGLPVIVIPIKAGQAVSSSGDGSSSSSESAEGEESEK